MYTNRNLNMKKTLLIILLLSASCVVKAQIASPKLVIMRIMDCHTGGCGGATPAIHITEDNGIHRVIEMETFDLKDRKEAHFPASHNNLNKIHLELKKYLDEGYEIVGHTKNIWNIDDILEDYVLVKK